MTKEEIMSGGGIEFRAGRAFAFGSEIAVLRATKSDRRVRIASAMGGEEGDEVEVECGSIEGGVYVVWHCRKEGKQRFTCTAIPAERVERKADDIEREILARIG